MEPKENPAQSYDPETPLLRNMDGCTVQQEAEWGEILTGFEQINKYRVLDLQGKILFTAEEHSEKTFLRWFLRAWRPFRLSLFREGTYPFLSVKRTFHFYFHELFIYSPANVLLGKVERRFRLLSRLYTVENASGKIALVLYGPLYRPWTFYIFQGGERVGRLRKRWSGLWKESFSDADNFTVEFSKELDPLCKKLLLAAVFLIDFVHFENRPSLFIRRRGVRAAPRSA